MRASNGAFSVAPAFWRTGIGLIRVLEDKRSETMRRAYNQVAAVRDGDHITLNLGFDFTSEHEWGIGGIERVFDCYNEKDGDAYIDGLRRFTARRVPEGFVSLHVRKATKTLDARVFLVGASESSDIAGALARSTGKFENTRLLSQWDANGFAFSAPMPSEAAEIVKEMHAAFLANDIAIYLGGRSAFGNPGLTITRVSTFPPEINVQIVEQQVEHRRLLAAAKATGIEEKIKEAVKALEPEARYRRGAFHALKPHWTFEDAKDRTAHPVMFFLNPTDQAGNNFGWFTVEELDQWADWMASGDKDNVDGGPIRKERKIPAAAPGMK